VPSSSVTSTTSLVASSSSTEAPSSTTSTTLAASCDAAGACDDGDPCTRDRCIAGRCAHDEAPGRAGALCRIVQLETVLEAPPARALPDALDRRLVRRTTAAVRLVGAAGTRAGSRDRLRRAVQQLAVVERVVARHDGATIAPAFAAHVGALVSQATARVTVLLEP